MSTIKSDLIGKDIRYKHWAGGEKTGVISDVFGNGNYEVTVGFSRVLVTPKEVISIEESKAFSRGGLLTHPDGTEMIAMKSKEFATRLGDETKFRATDYYETNNQDEIIEVIEKGLAHRYEFYDRHGNKFEAEEFGITSGRDDDFPHYMILDLDVQNKSVPSEVYLRGERYYGEAVFINGFNGYSSSVSDGMLSAVIDKSAVKDGDIHYLTTIQGELIRSKRYRGKYVFFDKQDQKFKNGGHTREHRYVNHSEDHEIRYAKDKAHRTGYEGKRKFEQGGSTPIQMKGIWSDGGSRMFFAFIDTQSDVITEVDLKTWLKSDLEDKSSDHSKQEVLNALLRSVGQFNQKVDFNIWSKQNNPTWEQKVQYLLDKNLVSSVSKKGIKVYEDGGIVDETIFSKGGNTRERRYVNHSEDHEIRYAKDKPHRTGLKGQRNFERGGEIDSSEVNERALRSGIGFYFETPEDEDDFRTCRIFFRKTPISTGFQVWFNHSLVHMSKTYNSSKKALDRLISNWNLELKRSYNTDEYGFFPDYDDFDAENDNYMEQGGSTPELLIYNTGKVDRFSRPIYKSKSGRTYVDVEMDDNNPSIHNVTRDGEPDSEIYNYRVVSKEEIEG